VICSLTSPQQITVVEFELKPSTKSVYTVRGITLNALTPF